MRVLLHVRKECDRVTPLEDVSATIQNGDAIAVIGPSGTGESTLLRCINLMERHTSGYIFVDGEDITVRACNINRIRTKPGMVFQSFNLYEHLTVVENCMLTQTVLLKTPRQFSSLRQRHKEVYQLRKLYCVGGGGWICHPVRKRKGNYSGQPEALAAEGV